MSTMLHLWLILLNILSLITAKQVHVIRFRTDNPSQDNSGNGETTGAPLSTQEMSFCFWMMPQFHRDFVLVQTKELELWFRGVDGGYVVNINHTPLNDTKASLISRLLPFCQTYTLGTWFSLCLGIKFTELTQQVKFYINGVKCRDQIFRVEDLKSIIYPETVMLKDL